jgi:hypothetical protein
MTLTRKSLLLASAAVVVMGLGMAKPAMAFDEVNWTWDSVVTDDIANAISVNIDIAPPGYAQLEKLQAHIGDVTATSTVTGFANNPPVEEEEPAGGPIPTTISLDLKALYDDNAEGNPITDLYLNNGEEIGYNVSDWEGHVDNNAEEIYLTFNLNEEEVDPAPGPAPIAVPLDAVDLPQLNSVATAIGNNQALEGGVALALHDAQLLFGGFAEGGEGDEGALEDFLGTLPDTGNSHTDMALGLALAGAMGMITPATVTAESTVTDSVNAMVNSEATAVANNMSVELASFVEGEAYFMGDVTQFAYADVSATSTVEGLTLDGYTGFADPGLGPVGLDDVAQVPVLNSVATAIGNNFSLRISGPDLGGDAE